MQRPSPLVRLSGALSIDALWLRKFATLGSVYGPEWFKRSSPYAIAAATFGLVGPRRRAAVRNMERVLGADRFTAHWAALRMFAEFAFCTSEAMEHYSPRARPIRVDRPPLDRDAVLAALRAGRGAVVVTGHVGSWDIAAKTLRAGEVPVHLVMSREMNAATQAFAAEARQRAGVHVVLSDASVFSSLALARALGRNEIVAIQLDRTNGVGGVRMLPFLGAPAPFPSGPFVLARLAGAPVIPVFAPRVGRRHYRVEIGTPVAVPKAARDPLVLERVMLEAVSQLEAVVRRYPWQWFQFAPFWLEETGDAARGQDEAAPAEARGE